MDETLFNDNAFLRNLLDAFPSPTLVVDADVRLLFWNAAARALLGSDDSRLYRKRSGEALECLNHRKSPEGCGHSPACKTCIIRNSVHSALEGGGVTRQKTIVEIADGTGAREFPLMVTTALFDYQGRKLSLLILEDISEIVKLREFLPMCANCKKIRDDKDYWHSVESYLSSHVIDMRFSHSICPACREKLYPGI